MVETFMFYFTYNFIVDFDKFFGNFTFEIVEANHLAEKISSSTRIWLQKVRVTEFITSIVDAVKDEVPKNNMHYLDFILK